VTEKAAVDITIDFDLSKSIVVEGPAANPSFKLKPVLHIVDTELAATIVVTVTNALFVEKAWITVSYNKDTNGNYTQEYTKVEITRKDPPEYPIFWLVPDEDYLVEIDYNSDGDPDDEWEVLAGDFEDGIAKVNF
jgi:hypothetical protein